MQNVTQLLSAVRPEHSLAAKDLIPLVYDELRELARQKLAAETPGQTLQATALVHEAFLRLVDTTNPQCWANRGHFFSAAAEAMRRILIEAARRRATLKRGGDACRFKLDDVSLAVHESRVDLLALDEALLELEQHDAQAARLVSLRYFAGLTHIDAAQIMNIERRAADRLWLLARTWLHRRLSAE